jgi:hypothetical protein
MSFKNFVPSMLIKFVDNPSAFVISILWVDPQKLVIFVRFGMPTTANKRTTEPGVCNATGPGSDPGHQTKIADGTDCGHDTIHVFRAVEGP